MARKKADISIVIPVFNEEAAIVSVHDELRRLFPSTNATQSVEIIYVNDGSTDDTLKVLKGLSDIVVIDLSRNYGQGAALDAGIKAASGDIVVTMDGDGQNDPSDIPKLLNALAKNPHVDVIAGWRMHRKDKAGIIALSRFGRFVRSLFIGDVVHDAGCTLRVYRASAAQSLELSGEMHRYIVALLRWRGFRIEEREVNHRPRAAGSSKYSYTKALRGGFDLIYVWFLCKYSDRPVHFFGYMSAMSFFFSAALGVLSIYQKIAFGISFNRNGWFFISLFLCISAIVSFGFGIVLDIIVLGNPNDSQAPRISRRYRIRDTFYS